MGSSGLEVTEAAYGGGSLGNFYRRTTHREALGVLEVAWEAGIRYFDTAPVYGRGLSERRLGAFLEDKPRDSFVLSTKVGRLLTPARGEIVQDGIFLDPAPFNPHFDYSYDGVMRSHEHSLQRLGLDRVDILYVHDIGSMIHGDHAGEHLKMLKHGGIRALEELRTAGDIRAYGLGVNETQACRECLDYGDPDVFLLAGRYTLLEQQAARSLLDLCLEREVAIVAGGVFNSGILATGARSGAHYNYGDPSPQVLEAVRELEKICARYEVELSHAALQFPLRHPAVVSVLLGSGTLSSLLRNLAGLQAPLPDELWEELAAASRLSGPEVIGSS